MAALSQPRGICQTRRRYWTNLESSTSLTCPHPNPCDGAVLRSRRVLHPRNLRLGPVPTVRSLYAISTNNPETATSLPSPTSIHSSDGGEAPSTACTEQPTQFTLNSALPTSDILSTAPLKDSSHPTSQPRSSRSPNPHPSTSSTAPAPPPYAGTMAFRYMWPRLLDPKQRPAFLNNYPVPPGKLYNINSFLGRRDIHNGQFLVPQKSYRAFIHAYVEALEAGYSLFLTENYHQQVYKYFIELDWPWDADLGRVMEITPKLIELITRVAGDFYRFSYPSTIISVRTPFKIHLNFPQLLTTELLASLCRDRILEACRTELDPLYIDVDWERLIDFPHGSFRMMGSRKAPHMDSDPIWVADKAYHPAKLVGGKWRPGRITEGLMLAASIYPTQDQVEAFERSPAYLDMVFGDLEACKAKIEERRRRHRERAELRASSSSSPGPSGPQRQLPPGSSKKPLHVTLEVRPDETVALNVYVKARFRSRDLVPPPRLLQQPQEQQEHQEGGRGNLDDGTAWARDAETLSSSPPPSSASPSTSESSATRPAEPVTGTGARMGADVAAAAAHQTAAVDVEEGRQHPQAPGLTVKV